jgi:hypothetical protein
MRVTFESASPFGRPHAALSHRLITVRVAERAKRHPHGHETNFNIESAILSFQVFDPRDVTSLSKYISANQNLAENMKLTARKAPFKLPSQGGSSCTLISIIMFSK